MERDNEKKQYTYLWFIENYSYCWHKNAEILDSPQFTTDGLEGSVFQLRLCPRGDRDENKGWISIYLRRCKVDDGPEELSIKYEISFLATDGSCLTMREFHFAFPKKVGYGCPKFLRMDEVLLRKKSEFLPEDTLSVCCKIWKGEGNIQPITQICARTRIGIQHMSFYHVVEDFTTLEHNEKKTIQLRSPSKQECVLSSSVYFSDGSCCEGKIIVEITTNDLNRILSQCKISLLDVSGKVIECGEADNRFDAKRKDVHKLPLSIARQVILDKKSEYLPDDKLSLSCKCVFSTGVEYEKIERISHEKHFIILNQTNIIFQDTGVCAAKLSECPSAVDDLKEIYNNKFLTDVELKTKTKSFPAHKILLCARSPVFKTMMTNDMKEKILNNIQVDDLDEDTVQQFLNFLYSDYLENLHWESAIKLYYAGDKYAVEKLKKVCSSFLVEKVTTSSVSKLLLLADLHNDCDLKKDVEDFIFKNEIQVYGSDGWEDLMDTNPSLVSKTMLLIHKRKNKHLE